MPQTRINTGFLKHFKLFKLNRPRRLTRQIVEYAVDAFHLIDDAGHNFEQHVKRDFCSFCGHKIRCDDCAQRNCIIVGSFIAHNANRTHVGQRCKELSQFLVAACFGKLFAVDSVCILNDANFLRSHLAYNTNTQTRTGERLTVYKVFGNAKFQTGTTNLIFKQKTQRLDDFLKSTQSGRPPTL